MSYDEDLVREVANLVHQVKRIADKYAGSEYKSGPPCVVEGQMVSTPNGDVPVEQLHVGTNVLSYNFSAEKTASARVISHRVANSNDYLLINGELAVTSVHKLYSSKRGWILASATEVGESLHTMDGAREITRIELIKRELSVYAVEVESHSCFFASGYLVHNKP